MTGTRQSRVLGIASIVPTLAVAATFVLAPPAATATEPLQVTNATTACGGEWLETGACTFPCILDALIGAAGSADALAGARLHVVASCGVVVLGEYHEVRRVECNDDGDERAHCFDFDGGPGTTTGMFEGRCTVEGHASGEFHCFSEPTIVVYDVSVGDRDGDGLPEATVRQGTFSGCLAETLPSAGASLRASALGQTARASSELECNSLSTEADVDPGPADPNAFPPQVHFDYWTSLPIGVGP